MCYMLRALLAILVLVLPPPPRTRDLVLSTSTGMGMGVLVGDAPTTATTSALPRLLSVRAGPRMRTVIGLHWCPHPPSTENQVLGVPNMITISMYVNVALCFHTWMFRSRFSSATRHRAHVFN